jgi:hypothetical protein
MITTILGVGSIEYPRPAGCTCPDETWCAEPNPICETYKQDGDTDRCAHCEHDYDCHTEHP